MAQAAIVALLGQTIGLSSDAIGAETIVRAVRQRMAQCGTSDVQTYLDRIQTSEQELHALIDEVIVPETWFFRDQMPFAYLGRYVMAEWFPIYQHAVLRVLSLACSTGEEPYSLAMALLDTGLASQHCRIDAVDVSHKALRWARGAVYGSHSFRGDELVFRQRYFEPCTRSRALRFPCFSAELESWIVPPCIGSASASVIWSRLCMATSWTLTCWLTSSLTMSSSAATC